MVLSLNDINKVKSNHTQQREDKVCGKKGGFSAVTLTHTHTHTHTHLQKILDPGNPKGQDPHDP